MDYKQSEVLCCHCSHYAQQQAEAMNQFWNLKKEQDGVRYGNQYETSTSAAIGAMEQDDG